MCHAAGLLLCFKVAYQASSTCSVTPKCHWQLIIVSVILSTALATLTLLDVGMAMLCDEESINCLEMACLNGNALRKRLAPQTALSIVCPLLSEPLSKANGVLPVCLHVYCKQSAARLSHPSQMSQVPLLLSAVHSRTARRPRVELAFWPLTLKLP